MNNLNWWQRFKSRSLPATKLDLINMEKRIMKELDDLEVEVGEVTTTVDSAVLLLNKLSELIKVAGTDPIKLRQLTDALDTQQKALADAVIANTPAENA